MSDLMDKLAKIIGADKNPHILANEIARHKVNEQITVPPPRQPTDKSWHVESIRRAHLRNRRQASIRDANRFQRTVRYMHLVALSISESLASPLNATLEARLITVKEEAERCGVSQSRIRQKIDNGQVPHVRIGHRIFVIASDDQP